MKSRLVKLAASLGLVVGLGAGATGLTACHENLSVHDVCNAFRAGEHWTLVNWTWAFGVYFCRATTSAGGFDEYCVFPDGAHWFERRECNWDAQAEGVDGAPA